MNFRKYFGRFRPIIIMILSLVTGCNRQVEDEIDLFAHHEDMNEE